MEITLNKNAFVITCNEKRYELFVKIFNYYNIPLPIKFWGCKSKLSHNLPHGLLWYRLGSDGCLFSHYSLYKIAQALDLPYLIVYEDDVFPRKNAMEYFNEAIKNVPDDWQFLKIEDSGFDQYYDKVYYNDYWFVGKTHKDGSGAGAYIIKSEAFNKIISYVENNKIGELYADTVIRYAVERTNTGNFYLANPMFVQHRLHNESKLSHFSGILCHTGDDLKNFEIERFL